MVNLLSHLLLFLIPLHCFVACSAANTKNITTDQYALLAFKSLITSDPYDMLTNNWSTSSSVCNWVGVTCDERHGRVHSLILGNMSLRGTVSPNLGNLSFLAILAIHNNSFGGQFPKEICQLRRLRAISISYNKFVGRIPEALGNLSQLQYLYLGANNFSGFLPKSIGNLRQLKTLDTIQNRLSGPIPPTISNISSLEVLHLSSNYFSEFGSKGIVSVKGDVYSYGIMLMEIFTRKKPTDDMFVAELSLKTWISGSLPNSIMEVMDSNLVQLTGGRIDDISTHMSSIFSLALSCCEDSPEARINMADVIASLIKIKALVLGANMV